MKIQEINLNGEYSALEKCELTAYLHTPHEELPVRERAAIIVFAGGGYGFVSERERGPVAVEFFNRDYVTFTLSYSIAPTRYPSQLLQACAAVDYIKKHAKELGVNKDKIFVLGFSAGGHLAGCLANCKGNPLVKNFDCGIAGVVLSYPVINYNSGHAFSYNYLLGDGEGKLLKKKEYAWLNLDESVTKDNPPAFIWATSDDSCVPVINSITYAAAYAKLNLKHELHVFKTGLHGLSLADSRVYKEVPEGAAEAKVWVDLADKFMKNI